MAGYWVSENCLVPTPGVSGWGGGEGSSFPSCSWKLCERPDHDPGQGERPEMQWIYLPQQVAGTAGCTVELPDSSEREDWVSFMSFFLGTGR